ncbi:MAG: amidohydrolase family protein [Clostridia bacterium]|nr:amidohydrolase family protein [Clostridia bacterium]
MKTLYKSGTIVDGSGNKPYVGDVLVENEKIIKVGSNLTDEADRIVDCTGLTVAPGFIDAHSHNDFFCDYDNAEVYFKSFIQQGITTQITGNCGFSPFGVASESKYKDKVGGGLFHTKNPTGFKEWTKRIENKLYVNVVPLIGHGTTRISLSGYDPAPLSKEQIAEEMKLVDEAMENGAFGGSFGFMYEPGMYSKKEELYAFASEIAKYDGIVTVHPRACSKVALGYPLISKPHIEIALDEVIDIMEKSKCRMEYSHLIFTGTSSWPSVEPMLKKFHDYKDKGYKIAYDNYSFTYGASVITIAMPVWYMAMTPEQKKKKSTIFKLKIMLNLTKVLLGIDFPDFTVAYIGPGYEKYEGRTVSDIAKEEGATEFDTYLKLVDLSNGQGRLYLGKYYNDEIINRLMTDDLSIFMTDAWIEESGTQNGSAFQCFPYFLVRAKQNNIPIEKVIRKMTGETADRFIIKERGYIKEGYYADLTIFDYNNIVIDTKVPDFTPKGIKYVVVNGTEVVDNEEYKTATPGKVVLKK